jgi:hypothetical protein
MKIDLQTPRYYRGLGDVVMWAWLAEGCRGTADPLVFHRTGDPELLGLLGLPVDPEPGGLSPDPVFAIETADRGRRPRLDYLRQFLGITAAPVRPRLHIPAADDDWAARTAADAGSPLVLLFPQTAWKTREWPPNYWVDLAWRLQKLDIATVVMLQANDERFHNTPAYRWNTPLPRVAALMQRSALVVGNDSFPAHLAGTVGVPTLALMGPTRPTVFTHLPDVTTLSSASLDCTGCHFQAPFRAACDQGCMSMYRLFPEEVLNRVLAKVRSDSAPTPIASAVL